MEEAKRGTNSPQAREAIPRAALVGRVCAVMAMALLCFQFAWQIPALIENQTPELKAKIEESFSGPLGVWRLKALFSRYLYATNRRVANGVIILNDGRLIHHDTYDPQNIPERAGLMIDLNNHLKKRDTDFLFINVPAAIRDESELPLGVEDKAVEYSSRFLAILEENGVDTLDLREEMMNEFDDFSKLYYWGDHHWNVDGALWAYGKAAARINRDYGFDLDERTWSQDAYERTTFHDSMLGSLSYRISGPIENVDLLTPKFKTEFTLSEIFTPGEEAFVSSGDFTDVFTPAAKNDQIKFNYDCLNATFRYESCITRCENQAEGVAKKVLLIGDSYSLPFETYLASAVKSVDFLYLVPMQNLIAYPMMEYEDYDLVLVLVNEGLLASSGGGLESYRLYIGEPPAED